MHLYTAIKALIFLSQFLTRDALQSAVLAVVKMSICSSVRLSVTVWWCIRRDRRILKLSRPHCSPILLRIPKLSKIPTKSPPSIASNNVGVRGCVFRPVVLYLANGASYISTIKHEYETERGLSNGAIVIQ